MADIKVEFKGEFIATLCLVFVVLKLHNVVSWSWWWVASPLWMPLAMFLAILYVVIAFVLARDILRNLTRTDWQWIGAIACCMLLGLLAAVV